MNPIKKILGHIYFFYLMLVFLGVMLIWTVPGVAISKLYSEPKRSVIVHFVFKIWIEICLILTFIRLSCSGRENFKKGEKYIVLVNHNSLLDIPIVTPWIPGINKTLAKDSFAKIPVFGFVYTAGSILVNRSSKRSRAESILKMDRAVKAGFHLCLYPEGTRNKTDNPLLPFYDGAFLIAVRTQKSIIPGILFHTKSVLPMKPKLWAWPHAIRYEFLQPIPTQGWTEKEVPELKQRVHQIMEEYFVGHQ